ncbi:MAG: nucleotidyltransferase [Phycisphaerae bacterium]|mgnify:CR=1 FL=1|nr:nucleotidyltransferase [Phycisphaerae bacterium]
MGRASLYRTEELDRFCDRWKVGELALFGSVLRDDFDADSDVDVPVSFLPEADWSLLDHVRMELEEPLGRKVELVSRRAIERSRSPIRRREILDSAEVFYAVR